MRAPVKLLVAVDATGEGWILDIKDVGSRDSTLIVEELGGWLWNCEHFCERTAEPMPREVGLYLVYCEAYLTDQEDDGDDFEFSKLDIRKIEFEGWH